MYFHGVTSVVWKNIEISRERGLGSCIGEVEEFVSQSYERLYKKGIEAKDWL